MTKDQALIHALEIMAPSIEESVDAARQLLRNRGADDTEVEATAAWWRETCKQTIVEEFEKLHVSVRGDDDRVLH